MSPQCPTATPRPLSSFASLFVSAARSATARFPTSPIGPPLHSTPSALSLRAPLPSTPPPAILLRESFRLGGKVRNRTLSNLSHWPPAQLDALRSVLKGATSIGPP